MMAYSKSILRGGACHPLHSFVEAMLQHFNMAPFQFTPNSFHIIVAFFVAFMEAGIGEPDVDEFTYVYGIKTLAHHEGFWYTTNRESLRRVSQVSVIIWIIRRTNFSFTILIVLENLGLYVSSDQYITHSSGLYHILINLLSLQIPVPALSLRRKR